MQCLKRLSRMQKNGGRNFYGAIPKVLLNGIHSFFAFYLAQLNDGANVLRPGHYGLTCSKSYVVIVVFTAISSLQLHCLIKPKFLKRVLENVNWKRKLFEKKQKS